MTARILFLLSDPCSQRRRRRRFPAVLDCAAAAGCMRRCGFGGANL
jgi:hypothetical protein